MVGVLSMILIAVKPEITLFGLLGTYIVVSLVWNVLHLFNYGVNDGVKGEVKSGQNPAEVLNKH
jgi:hypothetical protein